MLCTVIPELHIFWSVILPLHTVHLFVFFDDVRVCAESVRVGKWTLVVPPELAFFVGVVFRERAPCGGGTVARRAVRSVARGRH